MDLFPAIDIRSGRVVRLMQGEATRQTVYGDDPAAVAEHFVQQGARWLHVVDLDRALGTGENWSAVSRLIDRVGGGARIQLGGGLRDLDLLRAGLSAGVSRAVIGTAALTPGFVARMVAALDPDRLAVAIDSRNGWVALRGWTETTDERSVDLAERVVAEGIETVVYTDIQRDGMLAGPDLSGAAALLRTGAQVIISGGVSSIADLRRARSAGLSGVIVGRALYEGGFELAEAVAACYSPIP